MENSVQNESADGSVFVVDTGPQQTTKGITYRSCMCGCQGGTNVQVDNWKANKADGEKPTVVIINNKKPK
jgi:hypothetical protein